jgi:agmatinase
MPLLIIELDEIETDSEVFRRGIVTIEPVDCPDNPEQMAEAVYEHARTLLQDRKFVVGVEGEYSVLVGLVHAAAESFLDLLALQFDAHCDTRKADEGSRFNQACVMARKEKPRYLLNGRTG